MAATATDPKTLQVKSGWLCLDFANTADWHASEHPQEQLNSYVDFAEWAREVGLLSDRQAGRLKREAEQRADDAAVVLNRAIALREALYRIFSAMAHGLAPKTADLDILNGAITEALTRSRIVQVADGFAWGWNDAGDALDQMLWPVARSAADLLTEPDQLSRVGKCADDRGCGWLFVDTSRNRSRRWCDIKDCGNRAKQRRHYQRMRNRKS